MTPNFPPFRAMHLAVALLLASTGMSATVAQSCSLSAWSATTSSAPGLLAAGHPAATEAVPRYSGACAAIARAPGNFVSDDRPGMEPRYVARFYMLASAGAHAGNPTVFRAHGASAPVLQIGIDGGRLRVQGEGPEVATGPTLAAGRWYAVELVWRAGLDAVVRVQGAGQPASTPITLALGNAAARIDRVELGWIAGTGTGSIVVDAFESQRFATVGRLCRGDANGDQQRGPADVVAMRTEILGTALAAAQPDCNEDGRINAADLVCVRNAHRNGQSSCATSAEF
jgi:hypothetical protein